MSSTASALHQLKAMIRDLACWRIRAWVPTGDWFEGNRRVPPSSAWAHSCRLHVLTHESLGLPAAWPVAECRLQFGTDGYGFAELSDDRGGMVRQYVNEHHTEVRLASRVGRARVVLSPVRDSDSGYLTLGEPWRPRLIWIDPAVDELSRIIAQICDAATAMGQRPAGLILTTLAEEVLAMVEWPSATADYVPRIAPSEHLGGIWSPLSMPEHPAPLTASQRASLEAAAGRAREALKQLAADSAPQAAKIAVCAAAHIDLAWLWPAAVSEPGIVGHFSTAVGQLDRFPGYLVGQSAARMYQTVEQQDPETFERVKELVQRERWEILGGMWVEPDVNLPSGESIVRQMLYGQSYFQRHFGRRCRVCWLPDSFGFPGTLPQLLAGAGIDFFFTTKLRNADTNQFPFELFRWQALDGTQVLASMGHGPLGYRGDVKPSTLLATWRGYRQKNVFPKVLLPLGHSSGIGPTDDEVQEALDVPGIPGIPQACFSSVERFFTEADRATQHGNLPVWPGELYLEAHRGTFTSQGRTKFWQRRAEWSLVTAEVAEAMVAIQGGPWPTEMTALWLGLLEEQSHDVVTGTSIAEVHQQAEQALAEVCRQARGRTADAVRLLAGELTGDSAGEGVLLFNPTLSERPARTVLPLGQGPGQRTADGLVITLPGMVPPLGARWVSGLRQPASGVRVSETTLENELIGVSLDDEGNLAGVWDKRSRRELLSGPGNILVAYLDRPHYWDAWELAPNYARFPLGKFSCRSVSVVEEGPHRAAVRVVREFRDSKIIQEIRLWSGSARIDFVTHLEWHERRVLVRAYFPVTASAPYATFECPYGTVRRSTTCNTSWNRARFEVPAHRFVDLGSDTWGIALLNDARYGHRVSGSTMSISLLRSPVFPDPKADEGVQSFTYSLFPRNMGWLAGGVMAEAEDLNVGLPAVRCAASDGEWQPITCRGMPLALGALKCEDGGNGIVMRVYNPAGEAGAASLSLPQPWNFAAELNLLEDRLGTPQFGFRPHQIRTWLIGQR
jgi:alpha-mannosidase